MGTTKMHHELLEIDWWDCSKRDIAEFVAKCPNCQQVKVEHIKLGDLTQIMVVPTWNWESINMDFVVGLTIIRRQNDLIWVIVARIMLWYVF